MNSFSDYNSGQKSSGSRKKSSGSRKKSSGSRKKGAPSPAPWEKLNKIRDGIAKNRSLQRSSKTSFTLIKGKRPRSSLLKIGPNTSTSSSPNTEIVRTTTQTGKIRVSISPKPNERSKSRSERSKSRSIFSPTDNEVYDINNSILSNDFVAHNSDLSKKSPPQIKGNTPPINRKNSLEDNNSKDFRKTPVDKKHLKKPARYFDDDDRHLTPLEQYPMDSSNTNEGDSPISNDGDNLFEDLFNFSQDDQYEIDDPLFTKEISDIDKEILLHQQKTRELLKRKIELQEQERNKKNPCRSTKRTKTGGRGRGRGRGGSRSGRIKKGNTLMDGMKQLKF